MSNNGYEYVYNQTNKLIQLGVLDSKKIVLFGISDPMFIVKEYLEEKQYNITAFIDNSIKKIQFYKQEVYLSSKCRDWWKRYRISVYQAEDFLRNFDGEICILILSRHYTEMKQQLQNLGYIEDKHFFKIGDINEYNLKRGNDHNFFFSRLNERDTLAQRHFERIGINFSKDLFQPHNFYIKDYQGFDYLVSNGRIDVWVSAGYYWIFVEIFCSNIYSDIYKYIDQEKKYVVYDIGANRGYASLWFAQQNWCIKVESFELMLENCVKVKDNLKVNPSLEININEFGLGKRDEEIIAYYFSERDGISSMSKSFLEDFAPEMSLDKYRTRALIKEASLELRNKERSNIAPIIMKIDVEGAEYDIFENIVDNYPEFFEKVNIIIGEAHFGLERLVNLLEKFHFQLVDEYKT